MMKTRRNGDAITLYCGAEGCDSFYADVLPDRVLVYSRHYGRPHSTAIYADQFGEISLYACDGTTATVECVCGQQFCATVRVGQVVLESKHRIEILTGKVREVHQNIWGLKEVEQIASWLGLISATMPDVETDPVEVKQAS